MNSVLAVDPGPRESGFCWFDGSVKKSGVQENMALLKRIENLEFKGAAIVFERVMSYGMTVGASVFETVFWTGRMYQAAWTAGALPVARIPRQDVKMHLVHSVKARPTDIRKALLERWGGEKVALGTKSAPGPLRGVTSHAWAALALAVTWWDRAVNSGSIATPPKPICPDCGETEEIIAGICTACGCNLLRGSLAGSKHGSHKPATVGSNPTPATKTDDVGF